MFVYVARFARYPDFVKIGISTNVSQRMRILSSYFGGVVERREFRVGENYRQVENYLHKHFKEFNVRLDSLEGGTEFFKDCVLLPVLHYLEGICGMPSTVDKIDETDIKSLPRIKIEEEILRAKYSVILDREEKLICKILCRNKKYFTYSHPDASLLQTWIAVSLTMDFDPNEVFEKVAKHCCKTFGFTTPGRIKFAMALTENHSCKLQKLSKELTRLANVRRALENS